MCTVGLPRPPKVEANGLTARNWMKRISYYVPVTAWIPGYSWSLYVLLAFSSVSSPPRCGESGVDPDPETDFHASRFVLSDILASVEISWPD